MLLFKVQKYAAIQEAEFREEKTGLYRSFQKRKQFGSILKDTQLFVPPPIAWKHKVLGMEDKYGI